MIPELMIGVPELHEDGFRRVGRFGNNPCLYGGDGKGGGGQKPPAAPPPAPTLQNTSGEGDIAAQQMAIALNRGRTATMVTGGAGLSNMGTTSKTLLGN